MMKLASWAGVAAMVAAALALSLRPPGATVTTAELTDSVASSLRCPVCQGLSVLDSDSPTARDIRADIRRRLDAGSKPSEVRQAYVDRYGEWVLLRPGASGFEALAWALPAAAAGAGVVGLASAFWRWHHRRGRTPTDEERELVALAAAHQAGAAADEP